MCCGGSKTAVRIQIPALQPTRQTVNIRTQKINIGKSDDTNIQPLRVVADYKNKCPICKHSVMTSRVGGRIRKQCTNFVCRHILD